MGCCQLKQSKKSQQPQNDQKSQQQKVPQQQGENQQSQKQDEDQLKNQSTISSVPLSNQLFFKQNKGGISEDYNIDEQVGEGAFGKVFKATYRPLKQVRAIKQILKSEINTNLLTHDLNLNEIELLKQLDHPNILKLYEMFEDKRNYYIVSEFCPGGELFSQIVKLQRFNESYAAHIMFQLLSAISYCHDRDIIHRDLKPENLLVSNLDNLEIKVADFGSSVMLQPDSTKKGVYGTVSYLAPEVAKGHYNSKCDIWSCGIIMYVLLTGQAPYRGNEKSILNQVANNPFQIQDVVIRYLSDEAIDLMSRLLKKNPDKRITAKQAIQHEWISNQRYSSSSKSIKRALRNMKKFVSTSKLKQAVQIYITTHVIQQDSFNNLRKVFRSIDADGDGIITKEELMQAMNSDYLDLEVLNKDVNGLMRAIDLDNSGAIDYTEFIKACIDWKEQLSTKNLLKAFRAFDTDKSGKISVEEITDILGSGGEAERSIMNNIISKYDANDDGEIDFEEFQHIMRDAFNN